MSKTKLHGTGAVHRVIHPSEQVIGKALAATAPNFASSTGLTEPPDEDQGSSNSCTSQAFGYAFWQLTGCQILREDTYSHTRLAGGGAYLTSPADFVTAHGALLRSSQYVEPNPETESDMSAIVLAVDATGRTRSFQVSRALIHPDINTIGSLLEQYKGIIIGVDGSDAGWENMVDPTYNGQAEWGHALYVYDRAIRNGQNALKAKSSWCNEVKDHYINQAYFNAGGVFEALAITVKEVAMNLIDDNGTVYITGELGKIGIADPAALAKFQQITSKLSTGSTTGLPQIAVFKTDATGQHVLVDD